MESMVLNFFKKNKKNTVKEQQQSALESFEKAEAKFNGPELNIDDNLNIVYGSKDIKNLKNRFELLNESYNQLLKVENVRKQKNDVLNKISVRKEIQERIPTRRIYKLPIVKAKPNKDLYFDKNNIDDYIYQAIHGIISKQSINNEIQNEINEIRYQMANTKSNLNIDRRNFDQEIPAIKQITKEFESPTHPRTNKQVLEDVFSELDSMIKGDKAYIINGHASVVRSRKENSSSQNNLKKIIKNLSV